MFGVIFSIILVFLAVVGLIELFRVISFSIFKKENYSNMMIILPIKGHSESTELLLRETILRVKWLCGINNRKIVCIDFDMDEETKKICNLMKSEYEFIEICSLEELEENIRKELV